MSEENLKIADIIYAYIDGSITEGQLGELTRWLGAAAEHREVFERLIAAASYRDKEAIYRRFDEYYNFDRLRRAIRHQRRIEWRRIAAAAAVVILPLLVTFFLLEQRVDSVRQEYPGEMTLLPGKSMATLTLSDGSSKALNRENFTVVDGSKRIVSNRGGLVYTGKDTSSVEEEVYNTIRVPRGAEFNVTLDDGTKVWLNSESSIRFPVAFLGEERRIWVSGEVFAEVAEDAGRPFIMNTGKIDIKVLGTKFNVRAYSDE